MITCLLWLSLGGITVEREVSGQLIMNFDSEYYDVKFDVEKLREMGVDDADSYKYKIVEKTLCRSG